MNEKDYLKLLQQISQETGHTQIGDDAAIIAPSTVISTDQFIEGTHFLWSHMSAENLGYKAVVQALSDLAAMAALPTGLLTSIAWNTDHNERIAPFILGIKKACLDYSVPLVGVDISRSHKLFYADITVTGATPRPVKKSGARPGDIVAVTGTLGDARAGLESLDTKTSFTAFTERYEKPKAHIQTALKLSKQRAVRAMTDTSDSLSKSLFSLAEHSQVGFIIDDESIPVSNELRQYVLSQNKNLSDYKWNSGEDYQLLLTLPHSVNPRVLTDHGLTAIGRVTKERELLLKTSGGLSPLTEVGWDPFDL
ncbi:MAG: thiamine-phosphate kinase [Bdellovibrionaceae bacterium]|nr:thiamine-phosphate kinase [Pseudobdellovibrionaceae bacterium]